MGVFGCLFSCGGQVAEDPSTKPQPKKVKKGKVGNGEAGETGKSREEANAGAELEFLRVCKHGVPLDSMAWASLDMVRPLSFVVILFRSSLSVVLLLACCVRTRFSNGNTPRTPRKHSLFPSLFSFPCIPTAHSSSPCLTRLSSRNVTLKMWSFASLTIQQNLSQSLG